ncbi:MAG: IS1595 family transposase, partial [Elusimicrobiota bacterium]|nr:IS1595 family transposase [Elusimicrobiota bacterium]
TILSGEIEIDDTYYGGIRKGKRTRGAAGKIPVVGLRQRNGKVKTIVVPELKAEILRKIIRNHVTPGSTIYTDDVSFYKALNIVEYQHELINKSISFVPSLGFHIQNIESTWAHTKPDLKARHHKLLCNFLQEYLAENDFKFNNRQHPDFIGLMIQKLINFYPLSG